jgi:hypothetical protein
MSTPAGLRSWGSSLASRPAAELGEFFQDLRIGWRSLRKSPVFTITSVLILSFGERQAAFLGVGQSHLDQLTQLTGL